MNYYCIKKLLQLLSGKINIEVWFVNDRWDSTLSKILNSLNVCFLSLTIHTQKDSLEQDPFYLI